MSGGNDCALTLKDSAVAAGANLDVHAYWLGAGDSLVFNGADEKDGTFEVWGGAGNDLMTGGLKNDGFTLGAGIDVVNGLAGDDEIYVAEHLTAADKINGGAGYDTVKLTGDAYVGGLTFGADTLTGVDELFLFWNHDYTLKTHDENVGAGKTLVVSAEYGGAGDVVMFDGSAETNGRFDITVGDAADTLKGGAGIDTLRGNAGGDTLVGNGGNDWLTGGLGKDLLTGGAGDDRFVYTDVAESAAGAQRDAIFDFAVAGGDRIDLSGIDAKPMVDGDQGFAFIGTNAFGGVAGQLRFAVVNGNTVVEGDMNGDKAADFHIALIGTHALTAAEFLL